MNKYLSNKFRWLSVVATFAVVFCHSTTSRWAGKGVSDWQTRLTEVVNPLTEFHVPLFFIISGFMCVQSVRKYGWLNDTELKSSVLLKKLKTLYLPAVLWSVIGLVLCLPIRLYLGNAVGWDKIIKIPLLMQTTYESIQFWYVRNLLICFMFAPLFIWLGKNWLGILLALVPSFVIVEGTLLCTTHVSVTVLYFMLGVWLAQNTQWEKRLARLPRLGQIVCLVFGIAVWTLFALGVWPDLKVVFPRTIFIPLAGIGIFWGGYDLLVDCLGEKKCPDYLGVMFFVYCMHIIVIDYLGGIRLVIGSSPAARMFGWILLSSTFVFDVWVANVVRLKLPRLYAVLAGGR